MSCLVSLCKARSPIYPIPVNCEISADQFQRYINKNKKPVEWNTSPLYPLLEFVKQRTSKFSSFLTEQDRKTLAFRVACEANLVFWANISDLASLVKDDGQLLAECEQKLQQENNAKGPLSKGVFLKLGLNRGTALQLAIAGRAEISLITQILEISDVVLLRFVSIIDHWEENETLKRQVSTPLRDLLRMHPTLAAKALDKCLQIANNQDVPSTMLEVTYDLIHDWHLISTTVTCTNKNVTDRICCKVTFSPKIPNYQSAAEYRHSETPYTKGIPGSPYANDKGTLIYEHPLHLMATTANETLLYHPLVRLFVEHRWKRVRLAHHKPLCYFAFFLCFWEVLAVVGTVYRLPASFNISSSDARVSGNAPNFPKPITYYELPTWAYPSFYGTCIASWFGCGFVLIRLILPGYPGYKLAIYMEFASYLVVLYYCKQVGWPKPNTTVVSGVFGIILAWLTFMVYCMKIPTVGVHIQLFFKILWRYIRYLSVGVLLVCTFASTFVLLFHNIPKFYSIHGSVIATVQIVLSQFSTDEILLTVGGDQYGELDGSNIGYLTTVYLLLLLFLILSFLAFMNMLVGLAGDDTKNLLESTELNLFKEQITTIVQHAYYEHKKYSFWPYRKAPKWLRKLFGMLDIISLALKLIYRIPVYWERKRLSAIVAEAMKRAKSTIN